MHAWSVKKLYSSQEASTVCRSQPTGSLRELQLLRICYQNGAPSPVVEITGGVQDRGKEEERPSVRGKHLSLSSIETAQTTNTVDQRKASPTTHAP